MNSKNTQKGFTLIELMIVIAVMGIIAAIALPAYQNYVAKAQAAEAIKATEGIKTEIGLVFWETRGFPAAGDGVHLMAADLSGKYFVAGDVSVNPVNGMITVGFTKGVNKSKSVTLTPRVTNATGQINGWECGGTLSIKRRPSGC